MLGKYSDNFLTKIQLEDVLIYKEYVVVNELWTNSIINTSFYAKIYCKNG